MLYINNSWNPTVHAQLVLQLIVSKDVNQRAQNYLQFSRTEKFEELLLAWMRTVLEHGSLSLRLGILVLEQNFRLEITCSQNAVVKF